MVGIPGFPWEGEPLGDQLEKSLGLPVVIENDANCGALAEFRNGAGSRLESSASIAYLFVDHGVGGGLVLDGSLYRGADGTAGEIGHTTVDPQGPRCLCGNSGCLEAVASVESIVRRTVAASREDDASDLATRTDGDWEAVSFEAVTEAVEANDPIAVAALEDALSYLAVGITNLSLMFRPNLIVLGGYLFERDLGMAERLQSLMSQRPTLFGMKPVEMLVGELGGKACGIGAGTLVLENFFGVAHQVITPSATPQLPEPSFEQPPEWPTERGAVIKTSTVRLEWAGNLQPVHSRIRSSDSLAVTVDVRLAGKSIELPPDVKVLLHWDRVGLFGGHWVTPKNSPMQLIEQSEDVLRYGLTLGSLPPGRYEFAAHVMGKNDMWVRSNDEHGESNGRVEVIASRAAADRQESGNNYSLSGKEADRPKALVER